MSRTPHTAWRLGHRFAMDALIGFAVFMCAVVTGGGTHPPVEPRTPADFLAFSTDAGALTRSGEFLAPAASMAQAAVPVPVYVPKASLMVQPLGSPSVTLLAVIVSLLVAFDLALFRHLRRAYASSRRGGWRRG